MQHPLEDYGLLDTSQLRFYHTKVFNYLRKPSLEEIGNVSQLRSDLQTKHISNTTPSKES